MTDRVLCKYMIQIRSSVLAIHIQIQLKKMGALLSKALCQRAAVGVSIGQHPALVAQSI